MTQPHLVHIASLGCARNDVDSEELAARLADGGFRLVADPAEAQTVVVNTCGFIEQAKKDSIDTILAAADLKGESQVTSVVAVGCMAERYGQHLADELPEADAVLGFDAYADIAGHLRSILEGRPQPSHVPRDRRKLLPLAPSARAVAAKRVHTPGHAAAGKRLVPFGGPRPMRRRLGSGPSANLKIASGCDRRCAFCAIPSFRGSYLSRPLQEIEAEARWLVRQGVKEVFLVSENTSSYGKDLGSEQRLEALLSRLSRIEGLEWIRVSYLQPAEIRPGFIEHMLATDKVVAYFDLSFQHASAPVLRAMRRFGNAESFLELIERIRSLSPRAGIRSNVIAGFPGESEADVDVLKQFIVAANLDVMGVFAYSDEEGTEGVGLPGHLPQDEIEARRDELADLALEVCEARAMERIGEEIVVLVESADGDVTGRAAHQGPETDGVVTLDVAAHPGELVPARVIDTTGIDLIGEAR